MKKIFVFALMAIAILLAAAVIPQVQAVDWKTYKDPHGRFSIDYPANWKRSDVGPQTCLYSGDSPLSCIITVFKNPTSETKRILTDKKFVDEDAGATQRIVQILGKEYAVTLLFNALSEDFDYANKQYFEPMIKSVKVN